eukprot:scpid33183/ scgid3183/ Alpha-protein kinase vwkA; von Willebrand factor A alpha-kinase
MASSGDESSLSCYSDGEVEKGGARAVTSAASGVNVTGLRESVGANELGDRPPGVRVLEAPLAALRDMRIDGAGATSGVMSPEDIERTLLDGGAEEAEEVENVADEGNVATLLYGEPIAASENERRWSYSEDLSSDPSEVRLNVELLGAAEASVVSCADTDGAATPMPANRYERVNTPSREHTVKAMPSHVQDPAERERLKKEYARKLAEKQRGVNEINRQLRISEEVDLCFMVDATGSMQRWIDAVMSNIGKLYKRMQKLYGKMCCMRVAFVAYTDYDVKRRDRVKVFAFDYDPEKFQKFLSTIRADGGDDQAEDVMIGFDAVTTKLQWRKDVTKLLIHIADAPCHGSDYHDDANDKYPNGDPDGYHPDDMMKALAEEEIQYFFGRINGSTDRMIRCFDRMLRAHSPSEKQLSITSFNVTDPDTGHFIDNLENAVQCSIQHSLEGLKGTPRQAVKLMNETQGIPEHFHGIPDRKGVAKTFAMPESIDQLLAGGELVMTTHEACVRIAPKPFAMGSFRLAYHAFDTIHNKRLVVKQSQFKEIQFNRMKRYLEDAEVQAAAARFLIEFKRVVPRDFLGEYDIKMVVAKVMAFEGVAEGDRYMAMEALLRVDPSDFIKFNSNGLYVRKDKTALNDLVQAFSHWTWVASKKRMLVVDLQGAIIGRKLYLTDPVIHSKDLLRFGHGGNHGSSGMISFFKSHKCNDVCDVLKIREMRLL